MIRISLKSKPFKSFDKILPITKSIWCIGSTGEFLGRFIILPKRVDDLDPNIIVSFL